MARVSPLLPTFARGEVSPLMFGRADMEAYSSCLDKCRNCWVRPYGTVSRLPGTQYVNTAKGKARLLKFVLSAQDSYIIECGAGYFRFYKDGAYITSGGVIYEVANTLTFDQIETLQYVQLDDIIKFAYSGEYNNEPYELIRYADNNWVWQKTTFKCTPFLDENTTATTITPSAVTGEITITASAPLFNAFSVGAFFSIGGLTTVNGVEKQGFVKIKSVTDFTHAVAVVQWQLDGTSPTDIWREGAWSNRRGWPETIGIFEGRLYYGKTITQPRNIYGSRPYAYEDFTPATKNEEDGAINVELATNAGGDGSAIQWIVGANALIVGTFGSEFVVSGGDNGITPTNIAANARSNWGSEPIQPPTLGSLVYFVQRTGKKVRQFSYDFYLDTFRGIDVSIFSDHLLDSPIRRIAYQKTPDSILWCLRDDGKVAVVTIETDQQINAWALVDFGDGAVVESVETVPAYNGFYDDVYFIVKRKINGAHVRHIERMRDMITPDNQSECFYVRGGLTYSAFGATAGNDLTLSAKTGNITITTTQNTFSTGSVQKRIRVIDAAGEMAGEAVITEYTDQTTVSAVVVSNFKKTSYTGGEWGLSVQTLSGLGHLEGETVAILADGAVQTQKTVESGSVLMERDAFYITVGLPYQSYIKTMPLEYGSEYGTAVGKKKRIHELALRVWKTSGCRVGYDLEHLENVRYRDPTLPMGVPQKLFTGILPNVKYNQGWTHEASVTVEQSEPLPMNILAIAPILNEQDK